MLCTLCDRVNVIQRSHDYSDGEAGAHQRLGSDASAREPGRDRPRERTLHERGAAASYCRPRQARRFLLGRRGGYWRRCPPRGGMKTSNVHLARARAQARMRMGATPTPQRRIAFRLVRSGRAMVHKDPVSVASYARGLLDPRLDAKKLIAKLTVARPRRAPSRRDYSTRQTWWSRSQTEAFWPGSDHGPSVTPRDRYPVRDENPAPAGFSLDAPGRNRTYDLWLRRPALYPLSYERARPV